MPEITLINGDCLEEMKTMADNSIDACITDPPYGLEFMGKEWDRFRGKFSDGNFKGFVLPTQATRNIKCPDCRKWIYDHYPRNCMCGGVRREQMRHYQQFSYQWAKEVLRVLKPGGHLLSFGGTRTYHRMACAIEDAGFEIRDMINWIYGQGFPKSLNIGKQIDKMAGKKSENEWNGWGTALKPTHEPICLARKPLSEKTVAENVLKWGTGGINIDESRIGTEIRINKGMSKNKPNGAGTFRDDNWQPKDVENIAQGRFPANLILECICDEVITKSTETKEPEEIKGGIWQKSQGKPAGRTYKGGQQIHTNPECPCYILDRQSGNRKGWASQKHNSFNPYGGNALLKSKTEREGFYEGFNDIGGASRFFYCAKASKRERDAGCQRMEETQYHDRGCSKSSTVEHPPNYTRKNIHPTVKPIALMKYLITLVSRKGQTVLDIFLGSGSTGVACKELGRNFIGIEISSDYFAIAKRRIDNTQEQLF